MVFTLVQQYIGKIQTKWEHIGELAEWQLGNMCDILCVCAAVVLYPLVGYPYVQKYYWRGTMTCGKKVAKKRKKTYDIRGSQLLYQAQNLLRWSPLRGFFKIRQSETAKRDAPLSRQRSLARQGEKIQSFRGRTNSTVWFKGNGVKSEVVLQISPSLRKWCQDISSGSSTDDEMEG